MGERAWKPVMYENYRMKARANGAVLKLQKYDQGSLYHGIPMKAENSI